MTEQRCAIVHDGAHLELRSPYFTYELDLTSGVRAVAWTNHLTGRRIDMGLGPELLLDLDAASRRLWITGWRGVESDPEALSPDTERGYLEGYHQPAFHDEHWRGALNPAMLWHTGGPGFYWVRTHLFLPLDCRAHMLTLVLGGLEVFDFRTMRVFINGHLVGVRQLGPERWHEPGHFDLGSTSPAHAALRFGQDNIIALQLADPIHSTARLDELDPQHTHLLPYPFAYPAQFEQYVVVGQPVTTPNLLVRDVEFVEQGTNGVVAITVRSAADDLVAVLTYRWSATDSCLSRSITIANHGAQGVRLMQIHLGQYATNAIVSEGGQGFPAYLDADRFVALAHPAGWTIGQQGRLTLRQYPGRLLNPGETFEAMLTFYGVAIQAGARAAFLALIRSRMRRELRGHGVHVLYPAFGFWPIAENDMLGEAITEAAALDTLNKLTRSQREAGYQVDSVIFSFWMDRHGDLQRPAPADFPQGFANLKAALDTAGIGMGLWFDSSMDNWSIGRNPVVAPTRTFDPAYSSGGALCRATDPLRSMFELACLAHLREHQARVFMFDNCQALCYNPHHAHLPGLYSTEAIQTSVIEHLSALDAACPEVLLMLYWGFRSPWWLLYADTLFEPGLHMEGASPSPFPSLYARSGVTQSLDMAHWFCEDVPALGKDSLGIWLSKWPWNSSIGTERWQDGFVMDMCRGSLLAQIWPDEDWLSPAEWHELATFIELLRAQPDCFERSTKILGSPWRYEPYGYSCANGQRAFIALHNCTWEDVHVPLALNAAWGLPDGRSWDLYRWHPRPARLISADAHGKQQLGIWLRPFEVLLLEVVPTGEQPTLKHLWTSESILDGFAEPSQTLKLTVKPADEPPLPLPPEDTLLGPGELAPTQVVPLATRALTLTATLPSSTQGGTLVITAERRRNGRVFQTCWPGKEFALRCDDATLVVVPVLGRATYRTAWQAWRISTPVSAQIVRCLITTRAPEDVMFTYRAHFVPR